MRSILAACAALLALALDPARAGAQRATDRNPDVPEPMLFDLVRGLGARKGELEVNAIVVHDFRAGRDRFYWNPEIEWIVADGVGLELELAMDRGQVEAVKLMSQVTFGTPLPGRYIHGTQVIGERSGIDDGFDVSLLYIGAMRFSPTWSLNVIQGAKYGAGLLDRENEYWSWLGNATLFAEARGLTYGLEVNVESPRTDNPSVRLIPQLHWHRGAIAVQAGLGIAASRGNERTFAALRLIWTMREPGRH